MNYKILNLSDKSEWSRCLELLPLDQQDVYYTPDYYQLYENNGDGIAECFVLEYHGNIAVYPYLINSVNALGYDLKKEYYDIQGAYGYNGVVSNNLSSDFISLFYAEFNQYCQKKNIIAEFTRFNPVLMNHQFSKENLQVVFDRVTVKLDLTPPMEDLWKNQYSSKNRNMIRKGEKSLAHNIGSSNELLDEFVEIYKYTMEKIDANEYYYFKEIYYKNLLFGKNVIVSVFEKETNTVHSSMVLMVQGIYAHYHLSGRSENCSNNSVNNYMLHVAIDYAKKNGCKVMHFGGGNSKSLDDSLLGFKSNFSKELVDFSVGKKIHNKAMYSDVLSQWNLIRNTEESNKILKYREI